MIRNLFIFLGTFVAGAAIALAVRGAAFQPHAGHDAPPATRGDYPAQVTNPLTPAKPAEPVTAPSPSDAPSWPSSPPAPASADPHAGHHGSTAAPAAPGAPVNTRCAICGMPVDPSLPTLEYQGKTIGFGCKMCAPKFKADPDKYGPVYLRNQVIKK